MFLVHVNFILNLQRKYTPILDRYQRDTVFDVDVSINWATNRYVTLHHEMSRNVPDGHFRVFIFSESKVYGIYNGENHVQIRGLMAELHVFEYGGTTFGTIEKTC